MTLKDWFETRKEEQHAARPVDPKIDDYIGKLWVKCFNCNAQLPRKELEHHMMVCPQCGYHFRINRVIYQEKVFFFTFLYCIIILGD